LLKYRRIESAERQAKQYPAIHYASHHFWFRMLMALVGGGLVATDLLIARSATAKPYAWSEEQNIMYYALTRWTYVIGGMLIAFAIFFSPNTLIKELLRRPFFRMCGNLCLLCALMTPIIIQLNYNSLPDGQFISFYVVI
jgi:hypothetical protein